MSAEELSFGSKPVDQQQLAQQQAHQVQQPGQQMQQAQQVQQAAVQGQQQTVQQGQQYPGQVQQPGQTNVQAQQQMQQPGQQLSQAPQHFGQQVQQPEQAQSQPVQAQQAQQQPVQLQDQQQARQPLDQRQAQGGPQPNPENRGAVNGENPSGPAQGQTGPDGQPLPANGAAPSGEAPVQASRPANARNALGVPMVVAEAAQRARDRAENGFKADDFRRELVRTRRSRRRRGILATLLCIIAAIAVVLVVLLNTVFGLRVVQTSAMEPVMYYGQAVVLQHPESIAVGDVVAYEANGYTVFKRVIAAPGNWISIMGDGSLVISEEAVDNSTANGAVKKSSDIKISRQVPQGSYYVLGDAQAPTISGLANSEDFVTSGKILGKAMFRVWPITAIGSVQ